MKIIDLYVVANIFLFIFFCFTKTAEATWYFPMDRYFERQTVKPFGQLINDDFYKGKEDLFPFNRFYGYHAGVDLEAFPDEKSKKVPVFTIYSGTVIYIGNISGYGGVILQKLDDENATALYGHVKITDLSFKVGDHISVTQNPVVLTFLGDGFSKETSKERKHLHFGIHKSIDLYFRGHENSVSDLVSKWNNPSKFLQEKNAQDPVFVSPSPTSIKKTIKSVERNNNFLYTIINWVKALLKRE